MADVQPRGVQRATSDRLAGDPSPGRRLQGAAERVQRYLLLGNQSFGRSNQCREAGLRAAKKSRRFRQSTGERGEVLLRVVR